MPKRQRTEVKVEDEPAGSASTRSTRSIVKPDDRDPRLELLSDGVRLRRDTKTKVLTPSGSTTDLNVRSTCLEIDSSSARKQWPVLNISFERGVLRIMARSPADILAEAAISYTATFATEQASLFDCLLAGITGGKHGVVTLKFFKTVLEKDSGFLCYLVITILLAFTKATLQDTVTEFLRRVNKVKPAAATIAAVSSDYAERAKGILEKEVAKASTSVDSLNETLLVHLLGDLVDSDVDDEEGFNSGAAPVTTFVRKTTNDDVAAKPSRETQLEKLDTVCEQSVSVGFDTVHSSDLPKVQDRNGDQVNLEPAKKAMPHLEISIVDGILILKDRSPTDLLADLAIEYATKFGEKHRLYLEILAHQLMMKERKGLATIATLMQPFLGHEPGSVLLLLITALLAFRSSDLSLVARELLGRFHE
ncbi:protein of unknown function [Taphrina deformans PYCC 5710]|uniref:Uncharacterized protein n=1 Tax=Taphrina deformans (strain PYCC 5710 / ATCC 11124 / CBS 356.35 / IMI 108563 / JCM 9778 / NBRC 8474) TaxID=1097556 RepID=S0BE55_TAPDE|nr:protein of unknown function [Taphrina deformans PYCC 5710]|eukprot:CCG81547.1 protein of unknown function [Taphrina deformans PYCC 5710]